MNKKKIISISLIILAALVAGFIYFSWDSSDGPGEYYDKDYQVNDFPDALKYSDQERAEERAEERVVELNKEYKMLNTDDGYKYEHWINIGVLKKKLGDYQGAEEAWLKAASINDQRSLAYGNLAFLYGYSLKDYQKCEEYYLKAIDLGANNYSYYANLADIYKYNLTDKKDQVESLMLSGVEKCIDKVDGDLYMYLAFYFEDEGNLAKAKDYAQKAIAKNPGLKDQLSDF